MGERTFETTSFGTLRLGAHRNGAITLRLTVRRPRGGRLYDLDEVVQPYEFDAERLRLVYKVARADTGAALRTVWRSGNDEWSPLFNKIDREVEPILRDYFGSLAYQQDCQEQRVAYLRQRIESKEGVIERATQELVGLREQLHEAENEAARLAGRVKRRAGAVTSANAQGAAGGGVSAD